MHPFWSELAQRAFPYTPGEQPQDRSYIKLNTNECPYPPSPWLQKVSFVAENLQLYPDPTAENLRRLIAARQGLEFEEVFVGNGSDEILAFIFMAFMSPKQTVSYPDITYSFYPVYARLWNIPERVIPLREGFQLELADYQGEDGPVVIANPNAPTGISLPFERLKQFIQDHPHRLVIVDEAYVDFGAQSVAPLIHQYSNLIVVQTFSKSRAMAGARLGFAMGQRNLIEALERIKNSFNSYTVSRFTQKAGAIAILDEEYFQWTCGQIMKTRDQLIEWLRGHDIEVTDSKANFVWLRHPKVSGADLYQRLREKGILIRHFNQERIQEYIRVTIGTRQQMDEFKRAMAEI